MYIISRDLKGFSAAHRLNKGYEGKCKHLHGHSYQVTVTMSSRALDHYDMVIDFDDIKRMFDTWVQDHWDHVTLVSEPDTSLIAFLKAEAQDHFILPGGRNTTSEALAEFLFEKFRTILDSSSDTYNNDVNVLKVSVSESTYSHAEFGIEPSRRSSQ